MHLKLGRRWLKPCTTSWDSSSSVKVWNVVHHTANHGEFKDVNHRPWSKRLRYWSTKSNILYGHERLDKNMPWNWPRHHLPWRLRIWNHYWRGMAIPKRLRVSNFQSFLSSFNIIWWSQVNSYTFIHKLDKLPWQWLRIKPKRHWSELKCSTTKEIAKGSTSWNYAVKLPRYTYAASQAWTL